MGIANEEEEEELFQLNHDHGDSCDPAIEETLLNLEGAKISRKETVKFIWRYIWGNNLGHRIRLLVTLAISIGGAYCSTLGPIYFGHFTAKILNLLKPGAINSGKVASAVVTLLISSVLNFFGSSLDDIASLVYLKNLQLTTKEIIMKAVRKVFNNDTPELSVFPSAEITGAITDYSTSIVEFMDSIVIDVIPLFARFLFVGLELTQLGNRRLSALFFLCLLVNNVFILIYGNYRLKFSKYAKEQDGKCVSEITDIIERKDVIEQWNTEMEEMNNLDETYSLWINMRKAEVNTLNFMNIASTGIFTCSRFFTTFMSMITVIKNPGPNSVQLISSVWSLYDSLEEEIAGALDIYRDFLMNLLEFKYLNSILNLKQNKEGAIEDVGLGIIELRNVSFCFDIKKDLYLFKDVSLTILPNTLVAIVGANGSGKGTFCKLLVRQEKSFTGDIFYNGRRIQDYSLKALRSNILYCEFNESAVFGTLASTLQYGRVRPLSNDALKAELLRLELWDAVMSISDLNSEIGVSGVRVCDGEIAIILFVRALLLNTPVILFDGVLDHLDEKYEDLVVRVLNKVKKNRTIIIVTRVTAPRQLEVDHFYEINNSKIYMVNNYYRVSLNK